MKHIQGMKYSLTSRSKLKQTNKQTIGQKGVQQWSLLIIPPGCFSVCILLIILLIGFSGCCNEQTDYFFYSCHVWNKSYHCISLIHLQRSTLWFLQVYRWHHEHDPLVASLGTKSLCYSLQIVYPNASGNISIPAIWNLTGYETLTSFTIWNKFPSIKKPLSKYANVL